mgnify:CR=1 FL=1
MKRIKRPLSWAACATILRAATGSPRMRKVIFARAAAPATGPSFPAQILTYSSSKSKRTSRRVKRRATDLHDEVWQRERDRSVMRQRCGRDHLSTRYKRSASRSSGNSQREAHHRGRRGARSVPARRKHIHQGLRVAGEGRVLAGRFKIKCIRVRTVRKSPGTRSDTARWTEPGWQTSRRSSPSWPHRCRA